MKIAVIGAGPAGLFFARLIKRQRPDTSVDIFEQNPAHATYGFGVTLAGAARDRLQNADAEVHDRLAERMVFNNTQAIGIGEDTITIRYAKSGGAIARVALLETLEGLCREVDLEIDHEKRIGTATDLKNYDLVVGADGANSIVRSLAESDFRPLRRKLGNRFAWYGVNEALSPNGLSFRMAEGGCFVAHYYAYTSDKSTFVAECDAQTWTDAGLDQMSDLDRKTLVETVFSRELEGEKLQENKSFWRQFEATTVDNWHAGNSVLIGDALRGAHFSIGSGTRLAMDDALALFEAVDANWSDISAIKADYVARRKKTRDVFTDATVRSFEWYEDMRQHMTADLVSFVHGFLTRTGRIDDARLKTYAPEFYDTYIATESLVQAGVK